MNLWAQRVPTAPPMDMVVASSIWVSGPDSASVLSTPQARGERPSGSSRSVGPGRILKALMDYFPGLGPTINRLSGANKLMSSVADYRERQRTPPPSRDAQPA